MTPEDEEWFKAVNRSLHDRHTELALENAALRARVAELEGLLREAHAHLGDYCDDNEQAGFPTIAAMVAELLARIEAAVGVAGNKSPQ